MEPPDLLATPATLGRLVLLRTLEQQVTPATQDQISQVTPDLLDLQATPDTQE